MDTTNEKEIGVWVDQRLSALEPEEKWQPDVAMGLFRLKAKHRGFDRISKRWIWATAGALLFCLWLVGLPSPQVLAHRCLECSVAVWQSLAATVAPATTTQPENSRKVAPDFDLTDQNGNEVKLSGLKGRVVLVNFWATWCHGCQLEIPWFVEFERSYANQGLVIVGVSMDVDGWKSDMPWLKEKTVNYSIVLGNDHLGDQYGLTGMPLTVLVDRRGKVAEVHPGVVNKTETQKRIRALLAELVEASSR